MNEGETPPEQLLQQLQQYRQQQQQRYRVDSPEPASDAVNAGAEAQPPALPHLPSSSSHPFPPSPEQATHCDPMDCDSWQFLDNLSGDGSSATSHGHPGAPNQGASSNQADSTGGSGGLVDNLLVAVRRVTDMFGSSSSRAAEPPAAHDVVSDEESDEALARRLQAEEEALARGHGGHPFVEEPRPPASRAYHEQLLPSGPFPGASPGGGHGNVGESDEEMARRLQMEEEENARLIDEMQQGQWDEDDLSNLRHPPPFHGPLGIQQLLASMRGAPLPQERPSVDPALMHLLPFLGLGRGPHPDPQALALLAMLGGGGGPGLLHGDVDGASYEELLRLQERLGIVSRGASAEQIA
eukprot:EG_transcript_17909